VNAKTQALRAYSAASSPTRTGKRIEYEVIARITARLRNAANLGPSGFPALAEAVHENRRLWAAFAVDIALPSNPLPKELRARLFYLAEFTQQHSSKVLGREDTIEPLLDINTAIMRGLHNGAN